MCLSAFVTLSMATAGNMHVVYMQFRYIGTMCKQYIYIVQAMYILSAQYGYCGNMQYCGNM